MAEHSKLFSPSKAARRLACPGSARLEEGLTDTPSPYAEEGSAAHALAERCLRENRMPEAFRGRRIVRAGGGWSILQENSKRTDGWAIDSEMAAAVQVYVDWCRSQQDGATVMIEQRVQIVDDVFGTADHMAAIPFGPLYVNDYKHGVGVAVDPEWNVQAMTYALGAVYASPYDHDEVRISIIQPRSRQPFTGPIPWLGGEVPGVAGWAISVAGLYKWRDEVLLPGIERCKDPDAPLAAGSHCKFCLAYGGCPEVNKEVTALVQMHAPTGLPVPAMLTNEQIGAILDKADMAESWLKEVRALASRKVELGEVIPGENGPYKMVAGRGSRDWADVSTAEMYLRSSLGEGAYERTMLSPAKAEKALKDLGVDKKAIGHLIVKKEGGPTLAPANDKRPALASSAERAFANVPTFDIG